MRDTHWLAGAFNAYGMVGNWGKDKRVSLFTSSNNSPEHVDMFMERAGIGRIQQFKGAWQWVCDDAKEVQAFYVAVAPHLGATKRRAIEVGWEAWREHMMTKVVSKRDPIGPTDPGPITGKLFAQLKEQIEAGVYDTYDEYFAERVHHLGLTPKQAAE